MCLALPGRIEALEEGDLPLPFARVRFGKVTERVCLAYVPEAEVGDYVVVHVGFAIERLDEQAAERSLATFAAMAEAGRGSL